MRTLTERGRLFQAHPLQATFSLFASMLLGRIGCTGARLVGKVKDHFRLTRMV